MVLYTIYIYIPKNYVFIIISIIYTNIFTIIKLKINTFIFVIIISSIIYLILYLINMYPFLLELGLGLTSIISYQIIWCVNFFWIGNSYIRIFNNIILLY